MATKGKKVEIYYTSQGTTTGIDSSALIFNGKDLNIQTHGKTFKGTDTDTKVTSVDNHYAPSANENAKLTSTASSTGNYALNTEYNVVTGVSLQRDAKGHVTGVTTTNQKVKDTNTNTAKLQVSDTTNKKINTAESTGNYIQFTGGTNKFTVSDGTNSFEVGVTPSISNNVTGSGLTADKIVLGNGSSAVKTSSKGITTTLGSDDTTVPTSKAVQTAITNATAGLTGAMHFIGSSSTAVTDGGTETPTIDGYSGTAKTAGNVVLYSGKEYIWTGSAWQLFGDEGSYALKTVKVEGTGVLGGGGTLESNRTITHNTSGITAGSYGPTADVTGVDSSTIKVPQITVDSYGHVTGVTERTYTSKDHTYTVNNNKYSIKSKIGSTTTTVSDFTANQGSDDDFTLIQGSNITFTNDTANRTLTIAGTPDTKVTSVDNHYAPAANNDSSLNANASGATAAWSIDVVKGITLQRDAKGHVTGLSVSSGKIPANPNTDTKVTSVDNHYAPSANADSSLTSTVTSTGAYAKDTEYSVVTGINIQRDAKGHVTGVTTTNQKIKDTNNTYTVNNATYSIKAKVGDTTTTLSDFTANQSSADDFTLIQGSNITFTNDTTNRTLTIAGKAGTVTSVATGIGLTGGTITGSGTIKAKLKDETQNSADSAKSTSSNGGLYSVEADKSGNLAVRVPWTDTNTKVTSVDNHYAPAANNDSSIVLNASGATAAWSIDVVKGINVQRDAKGHVTGMSITSGKIPGNPNTDTKVTSVDNHYAPSANADSSLTSTATSTGNYALNTEYSVVTGINIQRDAKGHVTGVTTTNQKIKDTNSTYTVGSKVLKVASNTGTATQAINVNESSADRTLTISGDGTYLTGAVSGSANAATVTLSHADPTANADATLTSTASSTGNYALNTEYSVVTGVSLQRDAKGHVTGITTTNQKVKDTNNTYTVNNGTYSIKSLVGSTTTTLSDFTANQSGADDFTLVQGSNITFTNDTTNRKLTIAGTPDTKVTSVGNHYTPATNNDSSLNANASGATAAWSIDVVKGVTLQRDAAGHVTGLSVTSGKIPANPNTDTKVTAVGNHYTPAADASAELTAAISGTAGSYALNTEYTVLTGVKAQRDAKGHITGLTYTAQKVKDTNNTYTGYNIAFQNNAGTTVDTYKALTSPSKTVKAGSNITISAASNVITIQGTANTAGLQVSDTTNKKINTAESTSKYIQFTGGTNKFTISDGTNSFEVGVTPSISNNVTGSGLTADKIVLGNGSSAVKTSSKGITTTLGSDDTTVPTSKAVQTAITNATAGLSGAMHFIGTSSTEITDGGTEDPTIDGYSGTAKTAGNVLLYSGKEFVWTGSAWELFGDEGSYALKTIKVEGTGVLGGGGTLESNRTITHNTSGVTAASYGPTANVTGTNNTTIKVPQITVDSYGHVTGVTERTYTSKDTTYTGYNIAFQNSGGTTVDTYKALTSPSKTVKAGSNITISAASNVITIAGTADTKVTAVGNHYTPATNNDSSLNANASGATAAWSIDVVKGVTLQRDAAGHVTGLSVTSGKIPANPNTDTKVTAVGNHYTPSANADSSLNSTASSTANYAINTEYSVVTGINIQRDAAGHVTGVTTTNQKIKDTNNTYTGYNIAFQNNAGTTVDTFKALTSPNKTLKAGTNVQMTAASNVITISSTDTDTKVTSVGNHYAPAADASAELTASLSGTAGAYAINTEYTVLTGIKAQRDAKGHITGLTYTAQKVKDTNNTYTVNNGTYSIKSLIGSTTTTLSDFTANQSSADDFTLVQGSNITFTNDTTNRKLTIAGTADTKVTAVGNHYTPATDASAELTASLSGTAGAYAINTEYTVLTGVKAQRDAKGHITGLTYTAQKVKDTNTTYSTKNMSVNGTNYAIYTSASSLPTILAPTSYAGTGGQVLATNSNKNGLTWTSLPTKASWNYDDVYTKKTQAIPVIIGPSTDTTAGTWTGTTDAFSAYANGLTIIYVPAVAGAGTTTLNINGLGAKTCHFTNTSKLTTHFAVGTPIMFTYYDGYWKRADYDSNSNTQYYLTLNGTVKGHSGKTNLGTIWAPDALAGTGGYILATNSAKTGLEWVAKPAANVTTSAVVGSSASATTQISANQTNPFYNLIEGSSVTRSIQFKGDGTTSVTSDANGVITISSSDSKTGTVTSVATGVGLTGGTITSSGTLKAKLKDETLNSADSAKSTSTSGGLYSVEADKSGNLAVRVPWTDTNTKVTSVGNHYTPTTNNDSSIVLNASGATAAWSIDVVKGITLQRDAAGHVTGMSITSGKIPGNPNTDTKVTAVGNHYTPATDASAELTASISGTAAAYALNTEYTVLTGVKAQRDAKGHITGLTYTAQKIKDTNSTYTVGSKVLKVASNTGTATQAINVNESSADRTLTISGDGTYITGAVSGSANAATVTLSHANPTANNDSSLNASASGATAAWSIDVVKGVTIQRDAKGHVTGLSVTSGKIPAAPTSVTTATNANNVLLTNTIGNTEYPLIFGSSWTTGNDNQAIRKGIVSTTQGNNPLRVNPGANPAAGTEGNAYIVLGNNIDKSAANNRTGSIYMYGSKTKWARIVPGALSADRTFTLPDKGGTVAMTSDITDTKVTSVDNHYAPSANADSSLTSTASSTANYAINTEYSVVTGINIQRDAKGHVTGVTTTNQKIKDTNNTYTVGSKSLKVASNSGTATAAIGVNENSSDRTLTISGDGTYITGAVSGSANAATVTLSHATPTADASSELTASISGTAAAYAANTEYTMLTGVKAQRDAKGHITGLTYTAQKIKDTNTWTALSSSAAGYAPKAANGTTSSSSNTYYFLGYTGTTVNWYQLPANAFSNSTYTGYNIAFQNNAGTTVDTYKALTSPSKTLKAGSNITITAASNVITIQGTADTDTKVTAVGNHYAPAADASAELTAAISGTAAAYAVNTEYTVLTGVKAQRDAKGHVTGLTYTAQKIKDTNTWQLGSSSQVGYVPQATKGKFLHSNASSGALEWVDDNNTWTALSSSAAGYAPKASGGVASSSSNTYYFLGYTGTTVNWYQLPANAFNYAANTDQKTAQTNSTAAQESPVLIKNGTGTGTVTTGTLFASGVTINPSTSSLSISGNLSVTGTASFSNNVTMSDTVTIDNGENTSITIKGSTHNVFTRYINDQDVSLGRIGFRDNNPTVTIGSEDTTYYTLIHSGNIGEYIAANTVWPEFLSVDFRATGSNASTNDLVGVTIRIVDSYSNELYSTTYSGGAEAFVIGPETTYTVIVESNVSGYHTTVSRITYTADRIMRTIYFDFYKNGLYIESTSGVLYTNADSLNNMNDFKGIVLLSDTQKLRIFGMTHYPSCYANYNSPNAPVAGDFSGISSSDGKAITNVWTSYPFANNNTVMNSAKIMNAYIPTQTQIVNFITTYKTNYNSLMTSLRSKFGSTYFPLIPTSSGADMYMWMTSLSIMNCYLNNKYYNFAVAPVLIIRYQGSSLSFYTGPMYGFCSTGGYCYTSGSGVNSAPNPSSWFSWYWQDIE